MTTNCFFQSNKSLVWFLKCLQLSLRIFVSFPSPTLSPHTIFTHPTPTQSLCFFSTTYWFMISTLVKQNYSYFFTLTKQNSLSYITNQCLHTDHTLSYSMYYFLSSIKRYILSILQTLLKTHFRQEECPFLCYSLHFLVVIVFTEMAYLRKYNVRVKVRVRKK